VKNTVAELEGKVPKLVEDNKKLAGENEELRPSINELKEKARVSVSVFPAVPLLLHFLFVAVYFPHFVYC
jgi:hypothetical protein